MRGDDPRLRQTTDAERDAFVAGRDIVFHQAPAPDTAPRRIWGAVPARNPAFTGRKKLLSTIRKALVSGDHATVQALCGMGGVGKTQIAIEYSHRFANEYDVVWWIAAEQAGLISEQFAGLAQELGCAEQGVPVPVLQRAVTMALRERERWLLVFDNADQPEDLAGWLPGGKGHVLITTRTHGWDEVAVAVGVDVMTRAESVALLRARVRGLSETDANRLAEAVGDLPLACAQAARYLAETGMSIDQYSGLLADRAFDLMDLGRPSSYPKSLAAVTQLVFDQLCGENAASAEVARICAFLAPDPVPAQWFVTASAGLAPLLRQRSADPVTWRQVLADLGRSTLARVDRDGLAMHPLTQAIIRGQLSPEGADAAREQAETILLSCDPGDAGTPGNWPEWARLLPHLLAVDPAAASRKEVRDMAATAAWYLVRRGDAHAGHALAAHLYEQWRDRLGPDSRSALWAGNILGTALREMGRYADARPVDAEVLDRYGKLKGHDHPNTLVAANNLAIDLYHLKEWEAARLLSKDTLDSRQRVLGEDHPSTLNTASNLAGVFRVLGNADAAQELDTDTLARRRSVLGEDHPDTLASANNLACDLRALGDPRAAFELDAETLTRRRAVLGDNHPDTLTSASDLAADLRALGDYRAALELDRDTWERRRRVLGEDHPHTQGSENDVADDLAALEGK